MIDVIELIYENKYDKNMNICNCASKFIENDHFVTFDSFKALHKDKCPWNIKDFKYIKYKKKIFFIFINE